MHIIKNSYTSFVRYKPIDEEIFFISKNSNGEDVSSNKCTWMTNQFYVSTDFEIADANISFESKYLSNIATMLATKNPIERGVVIQNSESNFLDAYLFDMHQEPTGFYSYTDVLLEFNLADIETNALIKVINSGNWKDIGIYVFFDELKIIKTLNEYEKYNFENFSLPLNDFSMTY